MSGDAVRRGGVDVGRCRAAGLATALTRVRGVEGQGYKAAFGHAHCVESARLLLAGSKRAADSDGGQLALSILRLIEISRKR